MLLSECVSKTLTHNAQMNSERSISSSKCSKHVNICANILGAFSIGWPDDVTEALVDGVCPMGPQPMFGIYRRKSVPRPSFFKSFCFRPPGSSNRFLTAPPLRTRDKWMLSGRNLWRNRKKAGCPLEWKFPSWTKCSVPVGGCRSGVWRCGRRSGGG